MTTWLPTACESVAHSESWQERATYRHCRGDRRAVPTASLAAGRQSVQRRPAFGAQRDAVKAARLKRLRSMLLLDKSGAVDRARHSLCRAAPTPSDRSRASPRGSLPVLLRAWARTQTRHQDILRKRSCWRRAAHRAFTATAGQPRRKRGAHLVEMNFGWRNHSTKGPALGLRDAHRAAARECLPYGGPCADTGSSGGYGAASRDASAENSRV